MVDRQSATPLYEQLADKIAADIQQGTLKPGQQLPSEAELEQAHQMSRGTVRSVDIALGEGHCSAVGGPLFRRGVSRRAGVR
jgi:DNA-binding FadR family transcriptional regulator